jgi:hypothetical protein
MESRPDRREDISGGVDDEEESDPPRGIDVAAAAAHDENDDDVLRLLTFNLLLILPDKLLLDLASEDAAHVRSAIMRELDLMIPG